MTRGSQTRRRASAYPDGQARGLSASVAELKGFDPLYYLDLERVLTM